jgi:peptidoglycan/xylan/chitin deacetylase (PgdA/CDA1 family)
MSTTGTPSFTPPGIRSPYLTPAFLRLASTFRPKEIWRIKTDEKVVALTFDDGPSARFFGAVLAVLKQEDVRATFFLLGDRVAEGSDAGSNLRRTLVQQAAADGHEPAFHGWKHQSVAKYRAPALTEHLQKFRAELNALLPSADRTPVRFFRPPFGHIEPYVHRVMKQEAMRVVTANILPGDAYFFPSYYLEDDHRAVSRIVAEVRPGSIIALHVGEDLGRNDSVFDAIHAGRIVAAIIPKLRAIGYRFATMSELVK